MNEENNNLNLNQETQSVPQEPTKKNNIGPIIAILVLLCIVGGGAFFLLTKTDLLKSAKDDNDEETKEERKDEEVKEAKGYNGIYKSENSVLKLYCQENNECYIYLENDDSTVGTTIEIEDNLSDYDDIEFKFEKNTITVSENPEDEDDIIGIGGIYKKEKDYNMQDFYKDQYGNPELLNSKYNGYYEYGENKMYTFQTDEEHVRVYISGNGISFFDIEFEINEDGKLHEEFFENIYEVEVKENEAIFTTIQTDEEDGKALDGTYKKLRNIDYKEIIKNITP